MHSHSLATVVGDGSLRKYTVCFWSCLSYRVALGASREAWRERQSWQALFLGAQALRKQSGVKVVK